MAICHQAASHYPNKGSPWHHMASPGGNEITHSYLETCMYDDYNYSNFNVIIIHENYTCLIIALGHSWCQLSCVIMMVADALVWWPGHLQPSRWHSHDMMTSSNRNIFRVTGHRSPVNSPHKGQWCEALMFSLICVWINGWVNNGEAGDLRHHHAHYDGIVMISGEHFSLSPVQYQGIIYTHNPDAQFFHPRKVGSFFLNRSGVLTSILLLKNINTWSLP